MAKGTVKWFNPQKGFGFVVNKDGVDVFVHYTSIHCDGFRGLKTGQIVEYTEENSDKGLHGKNVRIICSVEPNSGTSQTAPKEDSATSD
jgi:CspA family cold shock protein